MAQFLLAARGTVQTRGDQGPTPVPVSTDHNRSLTKDLINFDGIADSQKHQSLVIRDRGIRGCCDYSDIPTSKPFAAKAGTPVRLCQQEIRYWWLFCFMQMIGPWLTATCEDPPSLPTCSVYQKGYEDLKSLPPLPLKFNRREPYRKPLPPLPLRHRCKCLAIPVVCKPLKAAPAPPERSISGTPSSSVLYSGSKEL